MVDCSILFFRPVQNFRIIEVVPRDGLRKRLHVIRGGLRLHMLLGRDGFAAEKTIFIADDLSTIKFTLENRTCDDHVTTVSIENLPAGTYEIGDNTVTVGDRQRVEIEIPVNATAEQKVTIQRK